MWLIGLSVGKRMLGCCTCCFISRLRTLWPLSRASVRIPQPFNSAPVLSRPSRSVFVGRVSAAGSGGNGRESGAPRRRRVWCGVQRSPHAQVSVGLFFPQAWWFPLLQPREALNIFCCRGGWARVFHGWTEKRKYKREVFFFFIQGPIFLLSQYDLLSCTL